MAQKKNENNNKLFIIDTNVLLHDPGALFAFENSHVGIPITVLEELDQFKNESSERGRNAREAARSIDSVRGRGSLAEGVPLDNGGTLQIFLLPEDDKQTRIAMDLTKEDNRILLIAFYLKQVGYDVRFISKDLNMRVKADALSLPTQDYLKDITPEEELYQGWLRVEVPASELKKQTPDVLTELAHDYDFAYNEFALLESQHNAENYRVFRYMGNNIFKPVEHPDFEWPFHARNPQQLMSLNLLMDPSVQLISMIGRAGTGKTFIALLAALHQLLIEDEYEKMLVTRPVVPLGPDIGFLPGDIQEKLHTWMQPIRDNMEYIVHTASMEQEQAAFEDQPRRRKKKGKKPRKRGEGPAIPSLDQLVEADKVSLEAITYMRGRSIPYQFIIIDEVQNLTVHEVKTLISRVGEGSKVILAGDPYQIDSPYLDFNTNGLVVATQRFRGQMLFGSVFLDESERSELSRLAGELL